MSARGRRRAAAAALLALALACGSAEERRARHLARAESYAAEGRAREALIELRAALQIDPRDPETSYRIARLLEEQGERAEAVFYFRETSRLDPARDDAALAEAKLLLFDDPERARSLIDGVLARAPGHALGLVRRSELALATGDAEAAREAALAATEQAPDDGAAWMQLGIVELARVHERRVRREAPSEELLRGAEQAFQRADRQLGGAAPARVELARLYAVWPGHRAQAEASFRAAVAVAEPGEPRARAAAAAMGFARLTRQPELLHWALDELVANAPARLGAWDALAALEDEREAGAGEAVYARLLAARPDDAAAHVRFARYLAHRGRFEDAWARLEAQARDGPGPALALDERVALELERGALEPARAALARLEREHAAHPRRALATGRVRLAERRFDEAAEALRASTGSEEDPEGLRLLAEAELARGRHPAALAAVDRALRLETTDAAAGLLRLRARIHEAAGDWPQVLATLNRLVRTPGLRARRADELRYARALYETGRAPLGRQVLERMLAAPEPPLAAYLEYAAREASAEPEQAAEALDAVLRRAPRHPRALGMLAARSIAAGRPERALARLDALAAEGGLAPALLLVRARVLVAQGDWARAEDDARRAFAAAPELAPALDLLVQIHVARGRVDEAIATLEQSQAAGALPVSGQVLLARLQLAAGRAERARSLYEAVLAAGGETPVVENDLAWLLAESGAELDRAQQLASAASAQEPDDPEFVDTLGYVFLRKGLHEPALEQFRRAVELARRGGGERPVFHHHLGLALRSLGRPAEAAAAFERALALDAAFPQADEARRELEAARGAAGVPPG